MTVAVLAWRVKSRYGELKTLAMVQGGTYAVVLVVEANGYVVHKSRIFNSSIEAEDWLRAATADGDLDIAPMMLKVEAPPETTITTDLPVGAMIHDAPFKSWAEYVVLSALERENLIQSLRAVTFKFGKPEPAFTR